MLFDLTKGTLNDSVKVFSSFYIQFTIAFFTACALVILDIWPWLEKTTKELQTKMIVAAMVEFHKAQCFFAVTLQIAALVLYRQSQIAARKIIADPNPDTVRYDIQDAGILVVLACTALLPVALALSCIVRYERQSW